MVNGWDDAEIHIPKKEYVPTEEEIYANGWNEKDFLRSVEDEHSWVSMPRTPLSNETEEECDKKNAIIQERWKRATGEYWGTNKYARLIL